MIRLYHSWINSHNYSYDLQRAYFSKSILHVLWLKTIFYAHTNNKQTHTHTHTHKHTHTHTNTHKHTHTHYKARIHSKLIFSSAFVCNLCCVQCLSFLPLPWRVIEGSTGDLTGPVWVPFRFYVCTIRSLVPLRAIFIKFWKFIQLFESIISDAEQFAQIMPWHSTSSCMTSTWYKTNFTS